MMDRYFDWLCDKVAIDDEYEELAELMYNMPFVYSIDRDANRYFDGLKLRERYTDETNRIVSVAVRDRECSVLEMLVALAMGAEQNFCDDPDDDHPEKWFWIFIENLGLTTFRDLGEAETIINKWLGRKFNRNGVGSPFPIADPECSDQRKLEIWSQFNVWFNENYGNSVVI